MGIGSEVSALIDAAVGRSGARVNRLLHMTEVLLDRLIHNNEGELLRRTFAPKAVGAAHLHCARQV